MSSPHNVANKYLGIHIALNLKWTAERKYVMDKTKKAARHILHTALRRDQIDMLLRTCIEPLFRYSAPLIPWTDKQLHKVERVWAQVKKASLKLTRSTDTSIVLLPQDQGGLGLKPAWHLVKELRTHIRQCEAREGELRDLMNERRALLLQRCESWDMADAARF